MPRAAGSWMRRHCARRLIVGKSAPRDSMYSRASPLKKACCSARPISSPRLTSAPARTKHKRMSLFRLRSRCRTTYSPAPSPTPLTAPRLKPFIGLIDKLGSFAGQIADEGIEAIEIEYEGDVAQLNTQPLTAVALAAVMRPLMPDINMVSAPVVLKQKGTSLTEAKRAISPIYGSLIRIKVLTGGRWRTLAGVVNAGSAKIVKVKGMSLEADFHPVMLLINNLDKP